MHWQGSLDRLNAARVRCRNARRFASSQYAERAIHQMSQREGGERVDGSDDIVGRLMQDVRSEQQEQRVNDPHDHEHATDLKSDDHYQSFDVGQARLQTTEPSGAAQLPRAILARRAAYLLESNVQVRHLQRVLFDELASRLDRIAHQRGEDIVRGDSVFDAHLQQAPGLRIDGGVPKLLWVHLTEPLISLNALALLCLVEEPSHRGFEARDFLARLAALNVC